ncbi:uncharacterized protein METZ01_LOCUS39481 [marine metagenome]|uniref:Uncharacterized protein n=1 Tax=marine metagenome TaxID=408172 RepID=A0A381R9V0_9ZZZZ
MSPGGLAAGPFEVLLQPVSYPRFRIDALHEFFCGLRWLVFFDSGLGPDHNCLLPLSHEQKCYFQSKAVFKATLANYTPKPAFKLHFQIYRIKERSPVKDSLLYILRP